MFNGVEVVFVVLTKVEVMVAAAVVAAVLNSRVLDVMVNKVEEVVNTQRLEAVVNEAVVMRRASADVVVVVVVVGNRIKGPRTLRRWIWIWTHTGLKRVRERILK